MLSRASPRYYLLRHVFYVCVHICVDSYAHTGRVSLSDWIFLLICFAVGLASGNVVRDSTVYDFKQIRYTVEGDSAK